MIKIKFSIKFSIIGFLLLSIGFVNAQNNLSSNFDTIMIKKHVTTLASDSFQGRAPFTIGEKKTVAYLTNYFKKLRLEPGNGKSYLQNVTVVQTRPEPAPLLKVYSKESELILQKGQDYALYSFAPDGEIKLEKAEVVFAGYGITAPDYGHDDYKGISVKDKVVIVLINERNQKESFMQTGREVTFYETDQYKLTEAARQGAKACLLVQPANAKATMYNIQANLNTSKMHLLNDNLCPIMGFMSRATLSKILVAANMNLEVLAAASTRSFKPVSLNLRFSTSVKTFNQYRTTQNVIAKIPGTEKPSEAVVYSAHWDHLGIGKPDKNGDSIYNGASDNAMGTAVLLEIAASFKKSGIKPKRTLVFLCAAAEESGHFGSSWYVQHTPIGQRKTVANINLDGFNRYGKTKDIVIIGAGHTELEDFFTKEVFKQGRYVAPDPEPEQNVYFGSDHLSFAKAGIPGIFIFRGTDYFNGGKEYETEVRQKYYAYHTPSDEYNEGWRFDGTIQDMEVIFNLAKMLANNLVYPKWKKTSEFNASGIKR